MKGFIKNLIRGIVDTFIRIPLLRHLIERAIRFTQRRLVMTRPDDQAAPSPTLMPESPGWQRIRTLPYVYKAPPGAQRPAGDDSRYFLVTSQGLAGSAWLASSLSLHPDITCAMGIDHPFVSMKFYYNHDVIQQKIDGVTRIEELGQGFYSDTLRKHFTGKFAERGIDLQGKLFRPNPVRNLQHMYDELSMHFPQKYYGNVHVCFAQQALEYLRENPLSRDITLMNLIRHPVPRTETAIKGILSVATHYQDSDWHKGITEGIDEFAETESYRRKEIEKRFGIDFTDVRNRAVLYSYYKALHNECWAAEITTVKEACHVTMESLMNDRGYYAWFFWELTQRAIVPSDQYLDQIFSDHHLNSGRHTGKGRSPTPRDQYAKWNDWEKYEFKLAVERLNLLDVYAPFKYDFSYLAQP